MSVQDEDVERIDAELARDEVPVHARPILTIRRLSMELGRSIPIAGSSANKDDDAIAEHVSAWYRRRYGDRVLAPTDLGIVPISIRDTLFFARIPLAYGQPHLNPLTMFEGVTPDLWRALSHAELQAAVRGWRMGYELVYEFEDGMVVDPRAPVSDWLRFMRCAVADRRVAAEALRAEADGGTCAWSSQQYVEKALKAFLLRRGGKDVDAVKRLGHDLGRLVDACRTVEPRFAEIASDTARLSQVGPSVRYEDRTITPRAAADLHWSSLRIAGACACFLSGQERRLGTLPPATFE